MCITQYWNKLETSKVANLEWQKIEFALMVTNKDWSSRHGNASRLESPLGPHHFGVVRINLITVLIQKNTNQDCIILYLFIKLSIYQNICLGTSDSPTSLRTCHFIGQRKHHSIRAERISLAC